MTGPGCAAALLLVLSGFLTGCRTSIPEKSGAAPPASVRRVDRVINRLLRCVPQGTCRRWAFVGSAVPNASVDATGTLRLTTGLLEFANTDDLLAFALAHEFGHVTLRHPQRHRRYGWLRLVLTGAAVWAAHEWTDSKGDAALAGAGVFFSTGLLGTLPALRRMEVDADALAKHILKSAGYRPEAGAEFWRRYARARPRQPLPVWISAHPGDEARARRLSDPWHRPDSRVMQGRMTGR